MQEKSELTRRWLIVLGCAIGIGVGVTGIPFYTLGLFVDPLQQQYGWSRAEIQGMFSVFTLTGILVVPLIGWLTDSYGVRRVVLISLLGTALAYLILGFITHSLTSYYIGAAILAILGAGTTPITWTKAISGWFNKQRGLALGLALSGSGVAGFLAPNYVGWLIEQFSWRGAYWGLALVPLLGFVFVYLLLKNLPSTAAEAVDTQEPQHVALQGVTVNVALRSYRFWLIAAAFFAVSIAIGGSIPNLVPLLMDASFERSQAASLVGILGVAIIAGRIIAGFILDRVWAPAVAFTLLALPAISAILLSQDQISMTEATLAIALIGFAAGAEFDLIAYLVSRYFGLVHYGKIYSLAYAAFIIGAGIAPPLFAYFYDVYGNYSIVMTLAAGLFLFGSSLLLMLGAYPDYEKLRKTGE